MIIITTFWWLKIEIPKINITKGIKNETSKNISIFVFGKSLTYFFPNIFTKEGAKSQKADNKIYKNYWIFSFVLLIFSFEVSLWTNPFLR